MHLLLPPSEGKRVAAEGAPLHLESLSYPRLGPLRRTMVDAVAIWCATDPEGARAALGLGPNLAGEIERNARVTHAPCAPAWWTYSGVLYGALDAESLDSAARERLARRTSVASALLGLVGLGDAIPAYRLSAGSAVPGVGGCAAFWRKEVSAAIATMPGLLVDLRSGDYVQCGPIPKEIAERTVVPRVLQAVEGGPPKVVTHFNKATKGRIVRATALLARDPETPHEFADWVESTGVDVVLHPPSSAAKPWGMDIIVRTV